jgi:hypothetical protein
VARLADLEDRVDRELGRRQQGLGPAGELALDLVRESWRRGARLARELTSGGPSGLVASWLAGPAVGELGFDERAADAFGEVVHLSASRWVGLGGRPNRELPQDRGVLVLLNRSGWPLPVEAVVLWAWLRHGQPGAGCRPMAVLWHEELPELPWISDFLRKIGLVPATADNAAAVLERGGIVLAFPEGRSASSKTYDRRYRLARFEGTAVLEAAVACESAIVPGAVIGSEESFALLGHIGGLPCTLQFPLFGLFGLLPLPLAWSVCLGAPLSQVSVSAGPATVDDIADTVRARMQALLAEMLADRPFSRRP